MPVSWDILIIVSVGYAVGFRFEQGFTVEQAADSSLQLQP